jgi:hypothetical protein
MLFDPANADNIPAELRELRSWVLWTRRNDTKVPIRLEAGRPVLTNAHDPGSWMSFPDALAAVTADPEIGLGLDLNEQQGLIGYDFDDAVDERGEIADDVRELLNLADGSYAELSPSRRGIRLICKGSLPAGCRKVSKLASGIGVERYADRRFVTITGLGSPAPIVEAPALAELLDNTIMHRAPPKPRQDMPADSDFDLTAVELFVESLSPARCDDYAGWLKTGSSLAAFGETFSDLWVRWSAGSPKFEAEACRAKWRSLSTGTSYTPGQAFGTLLAMAAEDTGRAQRDLLADVEHRLGRARRGAETITVIRSSKATSAGRVPAEPVPIGEIPLPTPSRFDYRPFPVAALPEPLRSFVAASAVSLVADPGPLALVTITACSAAIGTTHRVEIKRNWRPFPILWGTVLAASGDLKTPIVAAPTDPLRSRQARLKAEHDRALAEFDRALEEHEQAAKGGEDVGDPPEKPAPPARLLTSDATVESLGQLLERNQRGLLVLVDELVTLLGGMDRYKRGSSDEGFYLSCYDGLSHAIDRKGGGKNGEGTHLVIPRCAITVIGGLQPAKAQLVLDEQRRASGLVQRMLFAMPPRRAYCWTDDEIPPQTLDAFEVLINRLADLGGDGQGDPRIVSLSPAARQAFIDWTAEHADTSRRYGPDLAAAASKLREIPARIALILHLVEQALADTPAGEIQVGTMRSAIEITRWFRHEAERVFRLLEADAGTLAEILLVEREGAAITEKLWASQGPLSREDLARALGSDIAPEIVVAALAQLEHRGIAIRTGEGPLERWSAAPRPTMPEVPTFAEFAEYAIPSSQPGPATAAEEIVL